MLTKEQILQNKATFTEVGQKYGALTESLLSFLGEDLFTAPASTMLDLHNAFPGGLVDHAMKVSRYAALLNKTLPVALKVEYTSLVKVSMLSEIGKVFLYKECTSDWHRKNQGKMYEFNEELTSMRVGERSVYYALTHGVTLSEEEVQAIYNIDKPLDDKQAKWHSSTLGQLLRQATDLAILEEKHVQSTDK
jgi:hypothetical protein